MAFSVVSFLFPVTGLESRIVFIQPFYRTVPEKSPERFIVLDSPCSHLFLVYTMNGYDMF